MVDVKLKHMNFELTNPKWRFCLQSLNLDFGLPLNLHFLYKGCVFDSKPKLQAFVMDLGCLNCILKPLTWKLNLGGHFEHMNSEALNFAFGPCIWNWKLWMSGLQTIKHKLRLKTRSHTSTLTTNELAKWVIWTAKLLWTTSNFSSKWFKEVQYLKLKVLELWPYQGLTCTYEFWWRGSFIL